MKVEIADTELEQEIHKALAAPAETRNQNNKPFVINFYGDGNRRVRLRYVLETPIWKTSYCLILRQKTADKAKLAGARCHNPVHNTRTG